MPIDEHTDATLDTDDAIVAPVEHEDSSPSLDDQEPAAFVADDTDDVRTSEPSDSEEARIPKSRLDEVLEKQRLAEERARLAEARAAAFEVAQQQTAKQQASTPQPEQEYTRAQLQAFVDEDKITAEQMDAQLSYQMEQRVVKAAEAKVASAQRQSTIQQQLTRFNDVAPGWQQPGTDNNAKALQALSELQALNHDVNDPATHVVALRMAFGSPTATATAPAPVTRNREREVRDTHQETGSAAHSVSTGSDPKKLIPKDEHAAYADLIAQGFYTDWEEAAEDVKWSRSKEAKRLNPNFGGRDFAS